MRLHRPLQNRNPKLRATARRAIRSVPVSESSYISGVDPFRNELAAAHAKIEKLESEMHRLSDQVIPTFPTEHSMTRRSLLLMLVVMFLVGSVIAAFIIFFASRSA